MVTTNLHLASRLTTSGSLTPPLLTTSWHLQEQLYLLQLNINAGFLRHANWRSDTSARSYVTLCSSKSNRPPVQKVGTNRTDPLIRKFPGYPLLFSRLHEPHRVQSNNCGALLNALTGEKREFVANLLRVPAVKRPFQQYCMSYRYVDSFRAAAGSGWNFSSILILLESCLQTCMTYTVPLLSVQWITPWWWTEEMSETCRVAFQNKFEKLVHLFGFNIRKFIAMHGHMSRCTVTWTSRWTATWM
jgi:hypothetical protein